MKKPIRNEDARFVTPEMAKNRYNLCRKTVIAIAKEANAIIKYGRTVRIDTKKFDEYFTSQYGE